MFDFRGFDFEKALSKLYIYTGVFLTELQRKFVLSRFPPKHPNVYADHMTICFQPTAQDIDTLKQAVVVWPTHAALEVTHYASDEKGEAIGVKFDSVKYGLRMTSSFTHITLSCANGTSPVYSNKLEDKLVALPEPLILTGMMGICAQTDRNTLPRDMWKRRGLSG